MSETTPSLQLELQELLLVGVGAVPGAMLRWQLDMGDQNLLVNVLGAALLGLLTGPSPLSVDSCCWALVPAARSPPSAVGCWRP